MDATDIVRWSSVAFVVIIIVDPKTSDFRHSFFLFLLIFVPVVILFIQGKGSKKETYIWIPKKNYFSSFFFGYLLVESFKWNLSNWTVYSFWWLYSLCFYLVLYKGKQKIKNHWILIMAIVRPVVIFFWTCIIWIWAVILRFLTFTCAKRRKKLIKKSHLHHHLHLHHSCSTGSTAVGNSELENQRCPFLPESGADFTAIDEEQPVAGSCCWKRHYQKKTIFYYRCLPLLTLLLLLLLLLICVLVFFFF